MYKYKRETDKLNSDIEYTLSDNTRVCFSMSSTLKTKKDTHGMYIKNGKVLLENMIDTFKFNDREIVIGLNEDNSYITEIDLDKNYFEYDIGNIEYSKRIAYTSSSVLCFEYNIKNKERENAIINITPVISYKEAFEPKNNINLNFNQRETDKGVIISLSVLEQENLVLKSDSMDWIRIDDNINSCGYFSKEIKGFSETKIYVYVSYKEFKIEEINTLDLFNNIEERNKEITFGIDDSFIELKELSKSMLNTDMTNTLVASIPFRKEYNEEYINSISSLSIDEIEKDIDELTDIIRSIEGQLIYYKKVKAQKRTVQLVYKIIKEYGKLGLTGDIRDKYNNLRLWYIEAINRILQKETRIELYIDSIKEILFDLITPENRITCFNNFETTALMLNGIKIYLNILSWIGDTDKEMELQEEYFYEVIKREFWLKDKKLMKRKRDEEETYANVEMLYALSLSFPCVKDNIPNMILDSVFKELYTPYGIRKVSKDSPEYDNTVYPKYMAHFIKANLRLAGITRASQKISYNLVKELIQKVGTRINGGISKMYNEKGEDIDSNINYDTLTNAEMIRLYNMFV